MSYKAKTLYTLLEEINVGIFLPHIQRPFVWEEEQMFRLFDSLMKEYPIQTLLFWRTKAEIKARKFMDEIVWDSDLSSFYDNRVSCAGVDKTFVLDGQQRLQSLYAIFKGAIKSETGSRMEAYFNIVSGVDTADGEDISYSIKFADQKLPLPWFRIADLLGRYSKKNANEIGEELNDELDKHPTFEKDNTEEQKKMRQRRVRNNIAQLVSLLREEKHFWVQTLDGVANEYPYKRVLDIFVRVNSGGTKLDASDLMFAAMKEGWDDIEQVIENTTDMLNGTGLQFDKTFPLKCLLVVYGKGAEASSEKFDGERGDALLKMMEDGWGKTEVAFQELRDFIRNDLKAHVSKSVRAYSSFIPLFDYLYHNPSPSPQNRALMRAYHYKSQLFNWYSRGTDGTINALHKIVGNKTNTFPLEEIENYFRGRYDKTKLAKSDLNESRLRLMLLDLIYVEQFGGSPFDVRYKGNIPHVDHIYPQSALKTKLGLGSSDINHIGNFRFVGATDNIRKRAELPASYFSRLKISGVNISKHLLLSEFGENPSKLEFSSETYKSFRNARFNEIWRIADSIVNAAA